MFSFKKILNYLKYKFLFKRVIDNVFNESNIKGVIIFYKTSPFLGSNTNEHTNNNEIVLMSNILRKYNFNVHVIDRTLKLNAETVSNIQKYKNIDLFIGKGSGSTGDLFVDLVQLLKPKNTILYTTSENYELRNIKNKERYDYFFKRHNKQMKYKRNVICNRSLKDIVSNSDVLFSIGNDYNLSGYKQFNKKIYKIFPSTYDSLIYVKRDYKIPYSFLYFGGNGSIHKGLDILLDSFKDLDINLHICAPNNEKDFFNFYEDTISNYNIFFHGFVEVGSKKFYDIVKKNTFIILPSCSEASATSVATCIRTGLIPVITHDTGYDLSDYGYYLENYSVEYVKSRIEELSKEPKEEIEIRSVKSFNSSFLYTEQSFRESFEKSLISFLSNKGLL